MTVLQKFDYKLYYILTVNKVKNRARPHGPKARRPLCVGPGARNFFFRLFYDYNFKRMPIQSALIYYSIG